MTNPSITGGTSLEQRLGAYVLPGAAPDPRAALADAHVARELGLGALWIGERYDSKDLPSLAGALSQAAEGLGIGAAVTHPYVRHPVVLASMGQTLQALTGGAFRLGLGRSADWRWKAYGLPSPTRRALGDMASILRRLWSGETVEYEGPLGTFASLRLPQVIELPPPPLLLAAVGPKSLELAGAAYDGVILHPLLTVQGVADSLAHVRRGAERSGRDPDAVHCVAVVVTAPGLDERQTAVAVQARGAGYLAVPGLGDSIAEANGWAASDLAAFRAQSLLSSPRAGAAGKGLTPEEMVAAARALPEDWFTSGAAIGSPMECVARLDDYVEAGVDEIILHGARMDQLGPLLGAARDRGQAHERRLG
ncbi:MAG: TIGR03857 family LLM class F420-dependent oxidoreductase [Nocardioides sp.]|nr:TIGR03857 family LLM class F420-dependent oxidoreductase [Nocardioides sp.]